MDEVLTSDREQFEKLQTLLQTFSEILAKSGFETSHEPNPLHKQVLFQRQLGLTHGLLDISVQASEATDQPWHTASLEYRSLGGEHLPSIRKMPIKRLCVQVTSSQNTQVSIANYRQCSMQIYLMHPLSYQNADFLYQARLTSGPTINLALGVTWMRPEMQLLTTEAVEILDYIKVLLP